MNAERYEEARKSCVICNSCRYCEGLCAVFPAMEKKREFVINDIDYLANLCHQCGECFYDCQYAPPHEFNVSIPAQFASIRAQSYKKYAFPHFLGIAFEKNAFLTSFVLIIALFVSFICASLFKNQSANGDFFAVMPYQYMVGIFGGVSVLICASLVVSIIKYIKAINLGHLSLRALTQSIKDIATLKYLGGHNAEGCTYPNSSRSNIRRYFHHLTAYGFLFCFIATTLGAIYHRFFHIIAPYSFSQPPKFFGVIGGILLCIGVAGLFVLKLIADKNLVDKKSVSMDYALLAMLFIVSVSGFWLMLLKGGWLLEWSLFFHLSCVMVFFLMIPYSKFMHIIYRFLALLKYNIDEENH